jgi:hypothetical protein
VQRTAFGGLVGLWSLAGGVQNRPASLHARKRMRGSFLAVQARGGAAGYMQREGRETGAAWRHFLAR